MCAFDGESKLCIGCFSTLDEIRAYALRLSALRGVRDALIVAQ